MDTSRATQHDSFLIPQYDKTLQTADGAAKLKGRTCHRFLLPLGARAMSNLRTAAEVFEQEFLPIRAKLLEIAASLDRFGRAEGRSLDDPRWHRIYAAISALQLPNNDRAEQIQLIFSRPYEEDWQEKLGISE
jgi:hypothetical protein